MIHYLDYEQMHNIWYVYLTHKNIQVKENHILVMIIDPTKNFTQMTDWIHENDVIYHEAQLNWMVALMPDCQAALFKLSHD